MKNYPKGIESKESEITKSSQISGLDIVEESYVDKRTPEECLKALKEKLPKEGKYKFFENLFEFIELPKSKLKIISGSSDFYKATDDFKISLYDIFLSNGYDKKDINSHFSGDSQKTIKLFEDFYTSDKGRELIYRINLSNPNENSKITPLIKETPVEGHQDLALRLINEGEGDEVVQHIFDLKNIDKALVIKAILDKKVSLISDLIKFFPNIKCGKDIVNQVVVQKKMWIFNYYLSVFDLSDFDYKVVNAWAMDKDVYESVIRKNIDKFPLSSEEKIEIQKIFENKKIKKITE